MARHIPEHNDQILAVMARPLYVLTGLLKDLVLESPEIENLGLDSLKK
jgi:hypothetical protein